MGHFSTVCVVQLLSWFHFVSNWSILQMSPCSCSTYDCWRWWLAARRQYQSSLGPGNMLKVNLKRGTDVLALTKCLDGPNTDGGKQAQLRACGLSCRQGSNGSNEGATLKCGEHRTWRSRPFHLKPGTKLGHTVCLCLTDAVCFSLYLALPWKTNAGKQHASSFTVLWLPHGWITLC